MLTLLAATCGTSLAFISIKPAATAAVGQRTVTSHSQRLAPDLALP
jgi:hypothetical protein